MKRVMDGAKYGREALILALAGLVLSLVAGGAGRTTGQEPKPAPPPAPAVEAPATPPPTIDLSLVPADAPAVFAFRPADLMKLPELKAIYDEFARQPEVKTILDIAEPESVEQVAVVLLGRELAPAIASGNEKALLDIGALIVRTNKPREWKALAAATGIYSTKVSGDGKDYYRMAPLGGDKDTLGLAFYQPDDRTVVVASEASLKKFLNAPAPAGQGPKWRTGAGQPIVGHAVVAVDMAWLRSQSNLAVQAGGDEAAAILAMASPLTPLWEKVEGLVVAVDGTGGLTIASENVCADEAAASAVQKTVDAVLTLAQNASGEGLKLVRKEVQDQPAFLRLIDLAEQGVKAAKVEREGKVVRFKTTVKGDLVGAVRAVAEAR